MKELWDIYDKNRVLTGRTHERGRPLPPGDYHLVVEIWTSDGAGRLLVTRRHPAKRYGGLWECTAGSVVAGEDSLTGAKRELAEETGIRAEETELTFLGSVQRQSAFYDTYLVEKPVPADRLRLQPEEVTAARWVTPAELTRMCADGRLSLPAAESFHRYRERIAPAGR